MTINGISAIGGVSSITPAESQAPTPQALAHASMASVMEHTLAGLQMPDEEAKALATAWSATTTGASAASPQDHRTATAAAEALFPDASAVQHGELAAGLANFMREAKLCIYGNPDKSAEHVAAFISAAIENSASLSTGAPIEHFNDALATANAAIEGGLPK